MSKVVKRVAVTGGAGQIAYSLLFRIASGEMLGKDQPVSLHILEIPEALTALEGVKMELHDCNFPLLQEVVVGSDPHIVFQDIDYALLVGAKPRGPGMERADLLMDNAKIFVGQGKALNEVAKENVKVLVVGNPCNTNCLIAMSHAPRIPKKNFCSMMRLDENRAAYQLQNAAKCQSSDITNVMVWGNHSSTQVPDYFNARIKGKSPLEIIQDTKWLEEEFMPIVQKRGAAIISARGKSSAASAGNAIIDSIRSLNTPTSKNDWFSLGVHSKGNPYGVDENLVFSFPCRSKGEGDYEVVQDVQLNETLKALIKKSEQELIEERNTIEHLLG